MHLQTRVNYFQCRKLVEQLNLLFIYLRYMEGTVPYPNMSARCSFSVGSDLIICIWRIMYRCNTMFSRNTNANCRCAHKIIFFMPIFSNMHLKCCNSSFNYIHSIAFSYTNKFLKVKNRKKWYSKGRWTKILLTSTNA